MPLSIELSHLRLQIAGHCLGSLLQAAGALVAHVFPAVLDFRMAHPPADGVDPHRQVRWRFEVRFRHLLRQGFASAWHLLRHGFHQGQVFVELLVGVECQLLCMSMLLRKKPIAHVPIICAQCLVLVIKSQRADSCHGSAVDCNAVGLDGTFAGGLAFSELISFYSENSFTSRPARFCIAACQVLH